LGQGKSVLFHRWEEDIALKKDENSDVTTRRDGRAQILEFAQAFFVVVTPTRGACPNDEASGKGQKRR